MARFRPSKYEPGADSSKGLSKKANDQGAVLLAVKKRTARGQTDMLACPCGCGGTPMAKSTVFVPGHDARLRGILIRAHLTNTPVITITGKEQKKQSALAMAKQYGWTAALDAATQRRDAANKALVQKALNSKRLIKVGRSKVTGQVVAVTGNGNDPTYTVEYVTDQGKTKKTKVKRSETSAVPAKAKATA